MDLAQTTHYLRAHAPALNRIHQIHNQQLQVPLQLLLRLLQVPLLRVGEEEEAGEVVQLEEEAKVKLLLLPKSWRKMMNTLKTVAVQRQAKVDRSENFLLRRLWTVGTLSPKPTAIHHPNLINGLLLLSGSSQH